MKFLFKPNRAIASIIILSLLSLAPSCEQNANTVIKYVNRALPMITAVGIDISDAREVIDLMNQFQNDPKAATLSAATLAFDKLVAKVQTIPNTGKRTAIMVLLVSANIALQELAEKYFERAVDNPDDPRLGTPAVRMQIRRFSQKKRWICRAAGPIGKYKAGQFMPMEMCKKYPDSSVVETQ